MTKLGSQGQRSKGQRVRVLVIDDDDDLADLLRESLSDEGYAVATVRHGAAALDLLGQKAADVILLDLRMPIMDGWSFVRRYRDLARDGGVPIVLLSGITNLADIARDVGAEAYIAKPFDIETVRATIERVRQPRTLGA